MGVPILVLPGHELRICAGRDRGGKGEFASSCSGLAVRRTGTTIGVIAYRVGFWSRHCNSASCGLSAIRCFYGNCSLARSNCSYRSARNTGNRCIAAAPGNIFVGRIARGYSCRKRSGFSHIQIKRCFVKGNTCNQNGSRSLGHHIKIKAGAGGCGTIRVSIYSERIVTGRKGAKQYSVICIGNGVFGGTDIRLCYNVFRRCGCSGAVIIDTKYYLCQVCNAVTAGHAAGVISVFCPE